MARNCATLLEFSFFFFTFQSVYAPQSGLSDEVKDLFFDQLRAVTAMIPGSKFLIPRGDWNDHVGRAATGYREVHRGMGYGRLESDVEDTGKCIVGWGMAGWNQMLRVSEP